VAVVVTVVRAAHDPHVLLSVESLHWISYEDMALFVPDDAPDHERVTLPSETVLFTEQDVGAPQAVYNNEELRTL